MIVGVKRADMRRLDEMRVETGVKESIEKKLVRGTWVGRVERIGDEKRAERNGGEVDRNCDV